MSERREHKQRYNRRLEFIAHFERWLEREPPVICFWSWHRWKKERPVWKDVEEG